LAFLGNYLLVEIPPSSSTDYNCGIAFFGNRFVCIGCCCSLQLATAVVCFPADTAPARQ
jgi:hypothetical protein